MPSTDARRYRGAQVDPVARCTPSPGGSSGGGGQLVLGRRAGGSGHHDPYYYTTRKVESKTRRDTERRVQRRLVLPDGTVLAEVGEPEVVRDTVEDRRTRHVEDDDDDGGPFSLVVPSGRAMTSLPRVSLDPTTSGGDLVGDSHVRTVNTRDITEDLRTTATRGAVVGHVRRKELDRAIRDRRPLAEVVRYGGGHQRRQYHRGGQTEVLHSSKTRKKVVDTEDVHNVRRRTGDGRILTETVRTQQHEVFDDQETPDEGRDETIEELRREGERQRLRHAKKEEHVDYYHARDGRKLASGPRITAEEREFYKDRPASKNNNLKWDDVSEKIRRNRRRLLREEQERRDALTKRPLNHVHEERVKKKETDKWLERHFGSEWSLTNSNTSSGGGKHNRNVARRSMSFNVVPKAYGRHGDGHDAEEVTTTREKIVKTTTTTYRPARGERHKVSSLTRTQVPDGTRDNLLRHHDHHVVQQHHHSQGRRPPAAVTHSLIQHQPNRRSEHYRKYNSTQCLLPTPQVSSSNYHLSLYQYTYTVELYL